MVDEAALVHALNEGTIWGAGLDVYELEPVVHAGLIERDNVVLLPHLGSATTECRQQMARHLLATFRGGASEVGQKHDIISLDQPGMNHWLKLVDVQAGAPNCSLV